MLQAQFVTNNCDFKCSDPAVDAPRLYSKIKAGLKKVCGQQSVLGGSGATSLIAEGDLECFLSTERGNNLMKTTVEKRNIHFLREIEKPSSSAAGIVSKKDIEKWNVKSSRKMLKMEQ